MTTVHCIPYSCTLSAEACGKRHLATIANRGGRSSDAYPSCRRCPVGAANARDTGAEVTYAEHVSAYQVRHAPIASAFTCCVPGCDGTLTSRAPSSRLTPEFARLCTAHRRKAHNERERGATHAEALACVVDGRRYTKPAPAPRPAQPCTTPGCDGVAARVRMDTAPALDALCAPCRMAARKLTREHAFDTLAAVAHLAAVRRGERPAPIGRPRRSA
jgi:hypothetical protein